MQRAFLLSISWQPCDARRVKLGSLISRPLGSAAASSPRVALCDFGPLGTLELRQADILAPVDWDEMEHDASILLSFADSHDGFTLFQKLVEPAGLRKPCYAVSLFGPQSVVGKWAILRLKQTLATAKVAMK